MVKILPTLAGDANLSKRVNFYDFKLVLSNLEKERRAGPGFFSAWWRVSLGRRHGNIKST